MKLKSDKVFWPQIYKEPEPHFPALDRDVKCDVAIIGGGITGALAAYYLTREGIRTILVDRRRPGHGSTSASTGLLQYEIDTSLIELSGKIGRDRAIAAYHASVDALLAFEPLVAELGDHCGLVARPSLYLASREQDVETLHAECDARQSIGIKVEFLDRAALRDVSGLERAAALRSEHGYEIDPFHLTLKLIRRSMEKGLDVFTGVEIVRHIPRPQGITLEASNRARIDARKVIFATGYETSPQLPPGLCRLLSTYALVSQPLKDFTGWPGRSLIWESARPYLYLRTTEDDRVIVGGEDVDIVEPHLRDKLLDDKARKLCARFKKLFPAIDLEPSCAWAGTFAQTKDGLPYIGVLAQLPHSYFALGYGGNGITFSLLAARMLRDLFLGKSNKYMPLFGFDR